MEPSGTGPADLLWENAQVKLAKEGQTFAVTEFSLSSQLHVQPSLINFLREVMPDDSLGKHWPSHKIGYSGSYIRAKTDQYVLCYPGSYTWQSLAVTKLSLKHCHTIKARKLTL